jgi:Tfp pilus assembly protein PilF
MYRKAMDLNPQDDWYQRHFLFAGHYFRERGQFELAERAYRRARELNPSGITGTGIIWVLADQPDHREEALAQAIGQTEAQPKDLAAWLTLGYVRLQREELEDAATALRKAIEIGGDTTSSGEPWSYLAVVYEKRGQPQEAIQAYRKALSLYSDQPKSRAALRRLEVAQ